MLRDTIDTLTRFNKWRRGDDTHEMQPPKEIGEALDHAIAVLMSVENLIKQRGRHNTEIAYLGLVNAAKK